MNKEKQIEEMTEDLCTIECKGMKCNECDHYGCKYRVLAEALYNLSYLKASEVAREIFGMLREDLRGEVDMNYLERLIEIYEKKYTEGER